MSKYVDKMNLPQYRFYNHMVGDGEERKELISDLSILRKSAPSRSNWLKPAK